MHFWVAARCEPPLPRQSREPPLQMLLEPSQTCEPPAETKRQATQLTQAAAKRRDLQVDKVENQQWSWIAVAQASQLPQVVPQDVARPFASLGLPEVVPAVQAQALAGRCAAGCTAACPRRCAAAAAD